MGIEITSRVLPGGGVGHEIALPDGQRIDVVTRRDGLRDLVIRAVDGSEATVSLTEDESDAVADLLGAPKLITRLTERQRDADALLAEQLPIAHGSPYARRPLRDTRARTRTGASVVAVLRSGVAHPSPGPDFVLEGGDLVMTVGTREGLDQVGRILEGTG